MQEKYHLTGLKVMSVLLFALAGSLPGQQVLLTESFDNPWSPTEPPPGWRIVFDGDTAANDWHRAPDMGHNPWSDNQTPYALLDSAGGETNLDSLITPPMDCSPFNVVTLRCSTYFEGGFAPYTAALLGSVDGGPYQHLVMDYNGARIGPELQVFDLAWAAGQRDVRLAWVMIGPGSLVSYWAVDDVSVIGQSSSNDVGCTEIIAPLGVLDSGDMLVPRAIVKNFGSSPASFEARMGIGQGYQDARSVLNLAAGAEETVPFSQWTVGRRGIQDVSCYTFLPGDTTTSNDRQDTTVTVRVLDVAAVMIFSPRDTVDSGATVPVMARVRNSSSGTTLAEFYAYFRINEWLDSVYVENLEPNEDRDISFSQWPANTVGPTTARCSTAWREDRYPSDDTVAQRFMVMSPNYRDAAAVRILIPGETVRESAFINPTGVVKNNSRQPAEFTVHFAIDLQGFPVYGDSVGVTLAPGQVDTAAFTQWQALPAGDYVGILRVALPGDADPTNDVITGPFQVQAGYHDVGTARIVVPRDTMQPGAVTPSAWVRNFGSFPESFSARLRILLGATVAYSDSVMITGLAPGDSFRAFFRQWVAAPGSYNVRCTTMLATDVVEWNNQAQAGLLVESAAVAAGWRELRPVPKTPSGKDVKNGGGLTRVAGNGYIYALKGNKTPDFYRYDMGRDSWRTLRPIPDGIEEKTVSKGGALCNDGNRYVYATKGNSTDGFWRYDVVLDSWRQLAGVPLGPSGKGVKGGTSLVYAMRNGTGYCYLLKGYKNEYFRFNTAAARWESLAAAPLGVSGKNAYKDGSFIVHDGENSIYVVKAKYNEMFAYRVASDSWSARSYSYPLGLKNKKVKDGGCGTWYDGRMFTLKGGNTQEFWSFNPARDSWLALDTIPQYGSTLKKKKVKAGAGIVSGGNGALYALKGNKSCELWRYGLGGGGTAVGEEWTPGILLRTAAIRVRPNPVRNLASLDLPGPAASVRVHDIHGRLVMSLAGSGRAEVDCSRLVPGVYFVKVDGAGYRGIARLVKD